MERVKNKVLPIMFLLVSVLFTIPSIIFLIKNKTVFEFTKYYKFFINDVNPILQTLIYIFLLLVLTIIYLIIAKKQKDIFKNLKRILIFIAIVTVIFMVVLPFTSSDVYYYMGTGELQSRYGQNPYYVTMNDYISNHTQEVSQDSILLKGANNWGDKTVVYGPIWPLICSALTGISFKNVDICLLIFKIFNTLLHILNCYLIYKITGKKKFVLLYGLNPFVLLEGIANVHNDMLVLTLIFGAMYFLLKKKNILLPIILLAISACVKYFTVLLLPFVIIYYYRNENAGKRLLQCIKYGLIFVVIAILAYLIYFRDTSVLQGMMVQQNAYAKSLALIMLKYAPQVEKVLKSILLGTFALAYSIICIKMLFCKNIKFIKIMRKYNIFLIIFIFILITNFQPWYIMWLFGAIMWQKSAMIKEIIGISILSQFANSIFMIYSEYYPVGMGFILIIIIGAIIIALCNYYKKNVTIKSCRGD